MLWKRQAARTVTSSITAASRASMSAAAGRLTCCSARSKVAGGSSSAARYGPAQETGEMHMPRTKKQPEPAPLALPSSQVANGAPGEVMTLSETAAYLRLSESDVLRLVDEQRLPGRQLGKEWRFLKTAIQDWLRTGPPPKPSKEALLAAIGSWKDDPYLDEMLKEIYRKRGRPMTEEGK